MWVSIGLLERDGSRLFDSAVVISPAGRIEAKYRRISPRWHWPASDPAVFCEGDTIHAVDTPFGRMTTLICGDLFDENGQLQRVRDVSPDFLAYPLACRGSDWWKDECMREYSSQVSTLQIPVFLVNYIADDNDEHCGADGGAAVFSPDGSILASLPPGQESILYYTM